MNETYLQHHGILGMKWGIRRYQNEDGSLTSAGRKRYSRKEAYKMAKERESLRLKRIESTTTGRGKYAKDLNRLNEVSLGRSETRRYDRDGNLFETSKTSTQAQDKARKDYYRLYRVAEKEAEDWSNSQIIKNMEIGLLKILKGTKTKMQLLH